MTAAQDVDERQDAFLRWIDLPSTNVDYHHEDAALDGFIGGAEWAEERYRPLLEAARAYRDAHMEYIEAQPAIAPWTLNAAERALQEAARTFEADQEGR